ncbi:MAG: RtcB family protein, partial [Nanoarchaeota archaeon]|nr:RtcB family protein [Nanoarchaeota archaeon]
MGYKEQLKKVGEYEYELPKTGKMLVPGKILISPKLLELVEENAIQQVANVAQLPGIVKYSLAMSDMHSGYGFCIGGVAAFDVDKGVISPGGVGYDINCLAGDSRILTEFGTSKKIKDFENEFTEIESGELKLKQITRKLPSLNPNSKEIENKDIQFFMKKENEIYEIETDSGFRIKATADHPFLTKEGMKELKFIKNNEIAVFPFEGIEENEKVDEKLAILSKVFGYILGDGCVSITKNICRAAAYGKKEDLEKIKEDLEKIGVKSTLNYRERNCKVNNYYATNEFLSKCSELNISRGFAITLKSLGMPVGIKTKQKFGIPVWIKKGPKYVKRLFLAGFFGAELSSPKTHTKTGFYSPILGQNKSKELKENMRELMLEISEMLSEFGVKVNKISEINYPEVSTIRLIISADEENLLRLYRNIGFEYNKKRQNIANIASLYMLKKRKLTEERIKVSEKIKEYKEKGFKIKELIKLFISKNTNERFVKRHFYENAGHRITLDFVSFNEFKEKCLIDLEKHGCLFDNIKEINNIGKEKVYDFTIAENHNFIANSFIVSNCGIRLLATNLNKKQVEGKKKELLNQLFRDVPSGVGKGGAIKITKEDIKEILETGAEWAVKRGFGTKEDLERIEDYGNIRGAKAEFVSQRAISRGLPQLGSLGAGNHFLEVQEVEEIYDKETAEKFGIKEKGQITVMIHCGSRGLGHQVASDYIKLMEDEYGFKDLPDRELINAPINSKLGKEYFSAMSAAANFAFCNRQMIMQWTRDVFKKFFPEAKLDLVYDVCHNIAKIEEHVVDGKKMKLCVHRKGATRSFGPGREELPKIYRNIGQPIILPGSMGTASYILVGTKKAEEVSFASTAHGAGRVTSRSSALRNLRGEDVKKELEKKGIEVKSGSWESLAEEAPQVYKDIDEV